MVSEALLVLFDDGCSTAHRRAVPHTKWCSWCDAASDAPDVEAFGRLFAEDPLRAAAIFDVFVACDATWIEGSTIAAAAQLRLGREVAACDVYRLLHAASIWRSQKLCKQLRGSSTRHGWWKLFTEDRPELAFRSAFAWLSERAGDAARSAA